MELSPDTACSSFASSVLSIMPGGAGIPPLVLLGPPKEQREATMGFGCSSFGQRKPNASGGHLKSELAPRELQRGDTENLILLKKYG